MNKIRKLFRLLESQDILEFIINLAKYSNSLPIEIAKFNNYDSTIKQEVDLLVNFNSDDILSFVDFIEKLIKDNKITLKSFDQKDNKDIIMKVLDSKNKVYYFKIINRSFILERVQ